MSKDQQKDSTVSTDEYTHARIHDRLIICTEEVCELTKQQIQLHEHRLGVESYEEYFHRLKPHLREQQYGINDIPGLLFSRR